MPQFSPEPVIAQKLINLLGTSEVALFYCEYQPNWPILYISENIVSYGYLATDFLEGKVSYVDLVHPEDMLLLQEKIQKSILSQSSNLSVIIRLITPLKEIFWVDLRFSFERNSEGEVTHLLGAILDISDKIKARQKMSLLSKVSEQTDDLVKITDLAGNLLFVNDSFCLKTGYSSEEVIGRTPAFLKAELRDAKKSKELWDKLLNGQVYKNVILNRRKDGSTYYEEITISPVMDQNGKIEYFVSTGKDVSRRIEMQNRLTELAMKDALTGACNRHRIDEVIKVEMERSERYGGSFCLILLDVDYFKQVNDTYGHLEGDRVLIEMAKTLKSDLRKSDYLARWGGEEFLIVALELDEESALLLAEKFRQKIESHDFGLEETLTISLGVTYYQSGESEKAMLKRVDDALYQAKNKGRNRIEYAC